MTPFAIAGTVYLILLAICFAVSAVSLAVIAHKLRVPVREYRQINAASGADNSEAEQSVASDKTPADMFRVPFDSLTYCERSKVAVDWLEFARKPENYASRYDDTALETDKDIRAARKADLNRIREALGEYLGIPRTSWPTKNGASVEHGEG